LLQLTGIISCEESNASLYSFEGGYSLESKGKKISLNYDNLVLRGCRLKNTDYILGVVVYTGHETKIMQNSRNARFKMSSIQRGTNR